MSNEAGDGAAEAPNCQKCGKLVIAPNVPHARGTCELCGKTTYRLPTTEGLRVENGENVVIPAGSISISLDQRTSNGRLYRPGVSWLVQSMLLDHAPKSVTDLRSALASYREYCDSILRTSPLLEGLDPDRDEDAEPALQRIGNNRMLAEFWAVCVGALTQAVEEALDEGNAEKAAWLMSRAEVSRAILIYTINIEPFVWRGYNVPGYEDLSSITKIWRENRGNSSEEFWQQVLLRHLTLLSQVLHVPVVLYHEKAYLGGKSVDNTGGKYVDFLVKNPVLGTVAVLEIKTPSSPLLAKSEYRSGVYAPSAELSGAVTQLMMYRETLNRDYHRFRSDDPDWNAIDPTCILLVGDAETQLQSRAQRESFELYRRSLRNVEIITFDELFARLETLLKAITSIG